MFLKKFFSSDEVEAGFGVGDGVGEAVCPRAAALEKNATRIIPKWQSDLL